MIRYSQTGILDTTLLANETVPKVKKEQLMLIFYLGFRSCREREKESYRPFRWVVGGEHGRVDRGRRDRVGPVNGGEEGGQARVYSLSLVIRLKTDQAS